MTAKVSSPFASDGATFDFKRNGAKWDGQYGSSLSFDPDGQSFAVTSGRARAIRFRRVN